MVSAGPYVLSAVLLVVLAGALGFSAFGLRRWLMPTWEGAPARLVEAVVGVALLIWISELLGVVNLLYAGTLVAVAVLVAAAVAFGPRVLSRRGGAQAALGFSPSSKSAVRDPDRGEKQDAASPGHPPSAPPAGEAGKAARARAWLPELVAIAVVALVFAHWGLTAKDALGRGIFNFDSLWYHLPFAVEMAHSHSVTGSHYTETVFTNWFYPQNSELLHSVGILLTGRDTLSLFLNLGWLALALLSAWCIGRPYGRAPLTTVAAAVLLECHTLVVREPGAAKNDLMAAALLLAAMAILVNWRTSLSRVAWPGGPPIAEGAAASGHMGETAATGPVGQLLPLAVAGLATGLAVGTKSTAVAMAAALTVAVIVLAPKGRRWATAGWWFAAALAGGGYWYLRNLVIVGNPLPQLEHLGPISLPHPERLQEGRPDFSIAHYATDTSVWRDYFDPGLHQAFGALWPLVILAATAGALAAVIWGRPRVLRWMGAVALVGMVAYVFTPLSAAGVDGAPTGFGINIRYAIPALLAGLTLLPVALYRLWSTPTAPSIRGQGAWSLWDWCLLGAFLLLLVATNRSDAALRDPDRLFAWLIALLAVLIPAALLFARYRGVPRVAVAGGFVALAVVVIAIGYPVQRDYLRDRFANTDPEASIPGMHLDAAYRWARDVRDARIGLAGTTAGFLGYGFYGTDLSNQVRYLGVKAAHGAFDAIPTCAAFRAAVNEADLDYLVTSPLLDFVDPGRPVASPEARWLRGERAVTPVLRSGQVTIWKVHGPLQPAACGPANAPLHEIPQQPTN